MNRLSRWVVDGGYVRSEEHTSELQPQPNLVCRLLLQKNNLEGPSHHSSRRPVTSTRLIRSKRPALPTNIAANHPVRPTTIHPRIAAPNPLNANPSMSH